ncbi:hypothetical protein [Streptomyces sp. NPDC018045]
MLIERAHFDDGRPVETADILTTAERWDITYGFSLEPVVRP